MTADDLPGGDSFREWEPDGDRSDELVECRRGSQAFAGLDAGLVDEQSSERFAAGTENTGVTISVDVGNAVLVYEDAKAAENAFAAIDAEAFTACARESLVAYRDQNARPRARARSSEVAESIEAEGSEDPGAGDEAVTFGFEVDSSAYEPGSSDNSDIGQLTAVRVDRAVVILLFHYSGQYFEDFDRRGFEEELAGTVADRL